LPYPASRGVFVSSIINRPGWAGFPLALPALLPGSGFLGARAGVSQTARTLDGRHMIDDKYAMPVAAPLAKDHPPAQPRALRRTRKEIPDERAWSPERLEVLSSGLEVWSAPFLWLCPNPGRLALARLAGQGFGVKSGRHAQHVRVSSPRSPSSQFPAGKPGGKSRLAGRVFSVVSFSGSTKVRVPEAIESIPAF
jgi:hypothetical protein